MSRQILQQEYDELRATSQGLYAYAVAETVFDLSEAELDSEEIGSGRITFNDFLDKAEKHVSLDKKFMELHNDHLRDCYSNHFFNSVIGIDEKIRQETHIPNPNLSLDIDKKQREYISCVVNFMIESNSIFFPPLPKTPRVRANGPHVDVSLDFGDIDFTHRFEISDFIQWACQDCVDYKFIDEFERYYLDKM